MDAPVKEIYISVDVETAGPDPCRYSLLSIGACLVLDPAQTFYAELQPVNDAFTAEALQTSGLDMKQLTARGLPPVEAMKRFSDWVEAVAVDGQPVFVAFNAPFDWMFVSDYFHRHLGRNPFGHKALDIKAFFMGLTGAPWSQTGFEKIARHYGIEKPLTHHALEDAIAQAELFRRMLAEQKS